MKKKNQKTQKPLKLLGSFLSKAFPVPQDCQQGSGTCVSIIQPGEKWMWSVYSCREGDSSVHPTGLRSAPASIPGIKVAPSLILHENISRNLSIMENICRVFPAGIGQGYCGAFFCCFFNDAQPVAVISITPRIPNGGESRGGRKRGGSRLGLVFQRDKMVIQRDKIVIHRDNSHGRAGADGDFGLRESSGKRNKIGDLTQNWGCAGGDLGPKSALMGPEYSRGCCAMDLLSPGAVWGQFGISH